MELLPHFYWDILYDNLRMVPNFNWSGQTEITIYKINKTVPKFASTAQDWFFRPLQTGNIFDLPFSFCLILKYLDLLWLPGSCLWSHLFLISSSSISQHWRKQPRLKMPPMRSTTCLIIVRSVSQTLLFFPQKLWPRVTWSQFSWSSLLYL